MKQIRIISLLLIMALSSMATAQFVSPMDFMRNNPRANAANPAFYTPEYGYFDFLLGGFNFGLQKLGLKYDKFFRFNANGQPAVLDLNQGVESLNDVNFLNTYFNFDIFNCGRRTEHGYITVWHRIREVQSLSYNKDMMRFLVHGNGAFLGEDNPAEINLGLSARAFQEFAFGYQMSLSEHLNIGLRLKFLMGFIDAKTNDLTVKLYTDPDTYALKLMSHADIIGSVPYQLAFDGLKPTIVDGRFNVANLFKNYGGGVDLGVEYIFNEHWGAAAAVNDLGMMYWNNYAVSFYGELQDNGSYYADGAFNFSGITQDQINTLINDPDGAGVILDSLMGYLNITPSNLVGYKSGLNTNFMVRGYYDINPNHRFSAQFTGYNLGLGFQPAATIAYTGSFNKKYDVVATYTVTPGCYDNFGIGLSANLGGLLLFVASNNIFAFFNPANASMANIQVGLSFTGGVQVDRSETVVIGNRSKNPYYDDDDDDD